MFWLYKPSSDWIQNHIGNIYYNAMNVMDEIVSYIIWMYYKMYHTLKIESEDFVKSVN